MQTIAIVLACALLFLHWNVNTPKWVGYFVQRPKAHCIHHEEGLHAYNYSELPVFDWLFGTLRDSHDWQKTHGLGPVNELRFTEMLAGVDVSQSDHTTG
jgi:sterol desaturase/sphingolipid hydroxylase (fatty acid hydroxylase superfamily)